jgi:hypothetical protein
MVKYYRAFGITYSAYVEVKIPDTTKKEIQTAQEILDATLHKLFGSYKLNDSVTVCLCGVDRTTNGYVVFEKKE